MNTERRVVLTLSPFVAVLRQRQSRATQKRHEMSVDVSAARSRATGYSPMTGALVPHRNRSVDKWAYSAAPSAGRARSCIATGLSTFADMAQPRRIAATIR
jgi:hypothetical protein